MNESWKQAEADAHEAKADALTVAIDALKGCEGALPPIAARIADNTANILAWERDKHAEAATLGRRTVTA